MPVTSNRVIESAKGEIVKVLYMDDWLDSQDYLEQVHKTFLNSEVNWLVTSALNNKNPVWTDDIETGNNKLGSPSALAFRNYFGKNELFDEKLSWALDCELYKRMEKRFGAPIILKNVSIGIGIHDGQMTNILTQKEKLDEVNYVTKKYG